MSSINQSYNPERLELPNSVRRRMTTVNIAVSNIVASCENMVPREAPLTSVTSAELAQRTELQAVEYLVSKQVASEATIDSTEEPLLDTDKIRSLVDKSYESFQGQNPLQGATK